MLQDHTNARPPVFETERLRVRLAGVGDADLFFELWTDPRVMVNVGFPRGLPLSRQQVEQRLAAEGEAEFDRLLVVELRSTGQAIGECRLGRPDAAGTASTDIKLRPEFWGQGYGVEVKRGLLDYLFTRTDCQVVEATPNVDNLASIRMQEAVGGQRVGEGVFHFPDAVQAYTTPVHYYLYRVRREDWQPKPGL